MSRTQERAPSDRSPLSGTDRARRGRNRRVLRGLVIVVTAIALLVAATVGVLRFLHRGAVVPGTSVAGVDVGGMERDEVATTLSELVAARQADPVEFTYEDETFAYVPGSESYEADLDAAVDAALNHGRDGGPLRDSAIHVSVLWGEEHELDLPDETHAEPVRAWAAEVADSVDRLPFPGEVSADPETLDVAVTPADAGVEVRQGDVVSDTLAAIRQPGSARMPLPVEVLAQEVPDEDVQAVADQASAALEGSLTLDAEGTPIVLEPPEIARLIGSRAVPTDEGGRTLQLHVRAASVREVLEPYRADIDRVPTEARFEVAGTPPRFDVLEDASWSPDPAQVDIIPSTDGVRLDPVLVTAALEGLLRDGASEGEVDLQIVPPDLSTEDAEALNVTHLIGTFTTHHPAGQPRVRNIQRMADIVSGSLLRPGESFSVNGHVGRRTEAKGFVGGGTIVQGEFVEEVGGGVSQFATTMYNAAFFAGIEIPEHKAHSYYISRYPMGREATLYYPIVDLRIRNDTPNGVLIRTSYTSSSITVSLYGDNGGATVRAEHGSPHNHRTASDVVRRSDDLAPGSQRQVQGSAQGFDVVVHRHITRDGETRSERIFTRYEAQPRIIERGPDRAPQRSRPPPPDDPPEDDDD
jgi:vancomycin resistance protein YoaR